MSYVTGISGNVISAASAGYAPTNSAEVSAIASAYATGSEQVVTSLQYATSESATVASTVTADTAVGYGAKDISADYYDYGYGPWTKYNSSTPLIKVRMTAEGNMRNYSSYPYYLYLVPYGVTNDGNVSNTGNLTGARDYGYFSGDMNDFIVAEGTASASNPDYVDITFNVTHVPFVGSDPAFWGTDTDVPGRYVVDSDEDSKPVFCVAGGHDGYELFDLRSNTTAELDFGSIVTVSAVSGINELDIYTTGGGGADTSAVSAIASAYAESAVSSVENTVALNSARWNNAVPYSAFVGSDGIVTGVVSSLGWQSSVSGFMGVGSALKESTGVLDTAQDTASATADFGYDVSVTFSGTAYYPTRISYRNTVGSFGEVIVSQGETGVANNVSGIVTASSMYGYGYDFGVTYTTRSPEALAFQSDLTGAGVDSATVSAIASSYAESAVSSKLDESATADFYSTSNPSGFIDSAYVDSAVSGKADSSALSSYVPYSSLEYNTASAISGINGSALAAGSTYSAGEGIDITDDVISVEAPVDIVAGPGIVIDNPDGNTLRVSTDENYETVLYEKTWAAAGGNAVLSESANNFQQLRITFNIEASAEQYCPVVTAIIDIEAMLASTTNRLFELTCVFSRSDGGGRYIITRSALIQNDGLTLTVKTVDQSLNFSTTINSMNNSACRILKVVGIHRIANN